LNEEIVRYHARGGGELPTRRQAGELRERIVDRHGIDCTRLQLKYLQADIGHDRNLDLPEERFVAPVVVVAFEHIALTAFEFSQFEWTRADRMLIEPGRREVAVVMLGERYRTDDLRPPRTGKGIEERRLRMAQREHDRRIVGRPHVLHVGQEVAQHQSTIAAAFERLYDRRRIEWRAIMELHTVDQVEGVSQPVVRDLPALGEQTNDLGRTRLVFDETLVDVVDCADRAGLKPVVRIESADIGNVRYAKDLLVVGVDRRYRNQKPNNEYQNAQTELPFGALFVRAGKRLHRHSR